MSTFESVNVLDLEEAIGEEEVENILSAFSCPKNLEIVFFIKKNALDFSEKKMPVTYLVFSEDESRNTILGIYLVHYKNIPKII